MGNVHYIDPHKGIPRISGSNNSIDSGGEPPDDGSMESRVKKLEELAQDTRDRLARIETRMDTSATKSDLGNLAATMHKELGSLAGTMHKEINTQTWKLVTFVCGFGSLLTAAVYFIAKHVT